MQNKAPQGKPDPIPTPEQELEKYGVWVKAEPQDIFDEPNSSRETIDEHSIDGSEAILLPEDDDEFLDSFDLPEEAEESAITDDENEAFDDFESLSPLEEPEFLVEMTEEAFDLEALDSLEPEAPMETSSIDLDEDVIEDGIIDIELDELEYDEPVSESRPTAPQPADTIDNSSTNDTFATTDINIEDFGFTDDGSSDSNPSLENLGAEYASMPSLETTETSPIPSDDYDLLDIDLQFDDTIPEVETHESAELADELSDDFLDISSEFETVDIDSIGMEETVPSSSAVEPEPMPIEQSSASYQDTSLDSFIDDDENRESGIMPDMAVENVSIDDDDLGFDDIKAVTDDLSDDRAGQSSNLLQKIALELSSIKEELVSLRSQLSTLKASGISTSAQEDAIDEDSFEESTAGGFFDDEDDDTIALTGDELDNILNTADFTEEAVDESFNELEVPQLDIPDDLELLPEDGDYTQASEPGIELIDLPIVEPTDEEKGSINSNEGVTPLTEVPDDTSFLDAPSDDDLMELDVMDFEDETLVEPEESDLKILEDSTFGEEFDDEDLPILEDGNEEDDLEITLDIDASDRPVISTVDSFPESIEEIEEAEELEELLETEELGGLDLHSEEIDSFESLDQTEFDEAQSDIVSPPSKPVDYHPDELSTSLDDSLFVDSVSKDEMPSETGIEELSPLDDNDDLVEDLVLEPVSIPALAAGSDAPVPDKLKHDVKSVLLYLDQLLASLPEEKIEEFASSEYYDTYKHLFDDLGLL